MKDKTPKLEIKGCEIDWYDNEADWQNTLTKRTT